jgi:hypothetical protein
MKNSIVISDFIKLAQAAKGQLAIYKEECKKQEDLTQDYLHTLELEELTRDERAKIARQLSINRRDRRYFKDRVEELEPIVNFFEDPANKKCFNQLTQLLGTVRQAENYHASRTYTPKVLSAALAEKE